MQIHTFEVGPSHPCFIVAEIGSNFGGNYDAALALIDAAGDAGANAAKFQLWVSADELYDRQQFPDEWASADRYRLPVEWLPQLRDRAHERGMAFGLSSFGFASLEVADGYVDFHKVASIEAGWWDFVQAVRAKGKFTIISTGLMGEDDLRNLNNMTIGQDFVGFKNAGQPSDGGGGLIMPCYLQCVVAYPAALEDVNLLTLMRFPTPAGMWGYSDHTIHPTIAPCAAVALGACVIEKHLRLGQSDSRNMMAYSGSSEPPPDWNHSLWPAAFKEMVTAIRLTERALGSSDKRVRPSEQGYLKYRRGPRGLRGA